MGRTKVGRRADHYVTSWAETIVGLHRRGDGRWYPVAQPNHVFTESDERLAIHKFRLWEAEQKKGGPLSSEEAMQLNLRKLEAWQRWVETHPDAILLARHQRRVSIQGRKVPALAWAVRPTQTDARRC